MRDPDGPKRKISDRARKKLTALVEKYIESLRKTDLNAPKSRRGRPRKETPRRPTWAERRGTWARNWLRRRQGRTPNQERNQSLLDGYRARGKGVTVRAFAKQWFREWYGREPEPEDIGSMERQIDRLKKK